MVITWLCSTATRLSTRSIWGVGSQRLCCRVRRVGFR
jgi:hypothetical protein